MIFDVQTWFLKKENIKEINTYRRTEQGGEEISLLNIFSLCGNLLPILIAFGMSLILNKEISFDHIEYIMIAKLVNNGSLPLICYSIILSGLVFLLDKTDPSHMELRKKVLGISILLLFLSVSLYTLLTSLSSEMRETGHFVLFLLSIFLIYNAVKTTHTMVLLQQKIVNRYDDAVNENRDRARDDSSLENEIEF